MEQIACRGSQAANALRRLLSLKDEAHYGLFDIGGQDLQAALRNGAGGFRRRGGPAPSHFGTRLTNLAKFASFCA